MISLNVRYTQPYSGMKTECTRNLGSTVMGESPKTLFIRKHLDELICVTFISIYTIIQTLFIGVKLFRVFVIALFLFLFFFSRPTRKLATALVPFIIYGVSYDWMNLLPNYKVKSVDIQSLYKAERCLFGISVNGNVLIPSEYLAQHKSTFMDILSGLSYLCWVPVPMAFGVFLYFRNRKIYLQFALAFLFVNLLGFSIYYIHPAAPPWYPMKHGFTFNASTTGDAAGLAGFDQILKMPIFQTMYKENSNVFAAIPSLHSAYLLITAMYAAMAKCPPIVVSIFVLISVGIWTGAVYTAQHYVIDVLLGIFCAFFGVFLFEGILMRIRPFQSFMRGYARYIGVKDTAKKSPRSVLDN